MVVIMSSTLCGRKLAAGKTVKIEATLLAFSSSDYLDLYYAADATNPTWTYLTTLTPAGAGTQVLSTTFTLPSGSLEAVRASFRYLGTASPCGTNSGYDDHDDLIFAVSATTTANYTGYLDVANC